MARSQFRRSSRSITRAILFSFRRSRSSKAQWANQNRKPQRTIRRGPSTRRGSWGNRLADRARLFREPNAVKQPADLTLSLRITHQRRCLNRLARSRAWYARIDAGRFELSHLPAGFHASCSVVMMRCTLLKYAPTAAASASAARVRTSPTFRRFWSRASLAFL